MMCHQATYFSASPSVCLFPFSLNLPLSLSLSYTLSLSRLARALCKVFAAIEFKCENHLIALINDRNAEHSSLSSVFS